MTAPATDTTATTATPGTSPLPLPVPGAVRPAGAGLLTVSEMAVQMGVSARSVYRLIHAGELPALRIGHSFRIPATAPARRSDTNLTNLADR